MSDPFIDAVARNPRYQKAMAKLAGLPQNRKAIFDSLVVDDAFATDYTRKELEGMRFASGLQVKKARLALEEQGLAGSMAIAGRRNALDDKALRIEKDRVGMARNLGLLNIGLSGVLGWKERGAYMDLAARKRRMAERELSGGNA